MKSHWKGGYKMNTREQVLEMKSEGIRNKKISETLNITYDTVRYHIKNKNSAYDENGKLLNSIIITCKACKEEFNSYYQTQQYCSKKCRQYALNERVKKIRVNKPCNICGSRVNVHNGRCHECMTKSHTQICERCGNKFIARVKAKYCSEECRVYSLTCKYCNKEFTTRKNKQYCSMKCYNASHKKSHRQFALELLEAHNGMIVPLGMYKGSDYEIECMCLKCGGKINKVSRLFIGANKTGCPNCGNKSNGEDKIREWLDTNNYRYAQQYSIDEVKDKHKLLFDFAVFKGNELICLIEYDGEQHFKPVDLWGGIEALENIIIRDNIKNEYCDKNKILLIRIPYTTKNISDELMKQVNNGK